MDHQTAGWNINPSSYSTLDWKLLYCEIIKFLAPLCTRTYADFRGYIWWHCCKKEPIARRPTLRFDWLLKTFYEMCKKKESMYIYTYVYMYIKKRLFIQKWIFAAHLSLKLCLMNCFIKKLTRYKFDWNEFRGSFSRHKYINLYVLICKQSLAHPILPTYLNQKHCY